MARSSFKYGVQVIDPVKVDIEGNHYPGQVDGDVETPLDATPTRATVMLFCGAQLQAEDRDGACCLRVFIPLGAQIGLTVDLPRHYFRRV